MTSDNFSSPMAVYNNCYFNLHIHYLLKNNENAII